MTLLITPPGAAARPATADERWASVGHAAHADPRTAVAMAYGQLELSAVPTLLMLFTSPSVDREQVASAIGDLAPGVPLVGCTARGEISNAGQMDGSVVLLALGGPGVRCTTAMEPIVDGDVRSAAARAARCALELESLGSTVMVVLADGSGVDQDDIVRGAYDTVGAEIPLVGGCACGEVLQVDPALFRQGSDEGVSVASRSVVVATITSTGPIGIGIGHGFDPENEPHVVTSSGRNVVATLDEQPALDSYLFHHGVSEEILDDPEAFSEMARWRPLGVVRRGRVEPRAVIGADRVARTLMTGAPVPQGGLVWLMHTDVDAALGAIDTAAAASLGALDGARPRAVVAFDCGGRRGVLGADGVVEEIERLAALAGCPVAGLYTFGEIARTSGRSGFHNLTAVLLAFG